MTRTTQNRLPDLTRFQLLKQCGCELPEICIDGEWRPLGGDGPPEYCGSCLAEVMFA